MKGTDGNVFCRKGYYNGGRKVNVYPGITRGIFIPGHLLFERKAFAGIRLKANMTRPAMTMYFITTDVAVRWTSGL